VSLRLSEILRSRRKVYLDTSVFIYFIEEHPIYFEVCDRFFNYLEKGKIEAVTSTLTLTEILVQPYRQKNDELVLKFYSLFTTYPHLSWQPLTLPISDLAAKLRADHNLKTPDAIHAASALSSGTTCIICNDQVFSRIEDIDYMILDDCL
jgi:predicted nucleic acid-binding protein